MAESVRAGGIIGFRALYPPNLLDEEALWLAGLSDPRMTALSAHNVRLYPASIRGRRMHYFTLLRNWRAQSVSALRYVIQERASFNVPARVGTTMRDLLAWLYEDSQHLNFENAQTNHFALYLWCQTAPPRCDPLTYANWRADDLAAYQRERLDIAKDVLRSFMVVGLVERFNESMNLVRRRSSEFGAHLLPVERIEHLNVTDASIDRDESWLDSRLIGDRVLDSYGDDEALYGYATGLLDGALAAPSLAH
jgi:hypothetical protein